MTKKAIDYIYKNSKPVYNIVVIKLSHSKSLSMIWTTTGTRI